MVNYWKHVGNGVIEDSNGKYIGHFNGDFKHRDMLICSVNEAKHLLEEVAKRAKPVAWIDNSGHPKHLSHIQSITRERIYGKLRPLFDHPSTDGVESLKAELTELRLTSIHQDGVIIEQSQEVERLRAALIHIQQVACSESPELGIASEALAAPNGD